MLQSVVPVWGVGSRSCSWQKRDEEVRKEANFFFRKKKKGAMVVEETGILTGEESVCRRNRLYC